MGNGIVRENWLHVLVNVKTGEPLCRSSEPVKSMHARRLLSEIGLPPRDKAAKECNRLLNWNGLTGLKFFKDGDLEISICLGVKIQVNKKTFESHCTVIRYP